MMDDPIIRVEDVRDAGMCIRGLKQWLTLHGLDLREFLANGYPCSIIEPLNDALGNKVAAAARARALGDEP